MATRGQAMRNEVKEKLKKLKARVVGLQKQARDLQEHAERNHEGCSRTPEIRAKVYPERSRRTL